jgi:hypothetical protein
MILSLREWWLLLLAKNQGRNRTDQGGQASSGLQNPFTAILFQTKTPLFWHAKISLFRTLALYSRQNLR